MKKIIIVLVCTGCLAIGGLFPPSAGALITGESHRRIQQEQQEQREQQNAAGREASTQAPQQGKKIEIKVYPGKKKK